MDNHSHMLEVLDIFSGLMKKIDIILCQPNDRTSFIPKFCNLESVIDAELWIHRAQVTLVGLSSGACAGSNDLLMC